MKFSTILVSVLFIIFTTGCIYKTPVQQGNVLAQKDVDQILPSMSKRQVAIILGTPAIADPFNHDRWDYVNTFKIDGKIDKIKRLTLFFKDNKLVRTEGNYFPEKNSEKLTEKNTETE
ncbi:MAG TPA: outer membrane protein assembly factor BamE [Oceanospirillales bacterium]|nr:outer membrane protein assembly factor BamE [Oceanospirillales bacterium]